MRQLVILFPTAWRDVPVVPGEIVDVADAEDEAAAEWLIRAGAARLRRAIEAAKPPPAPAAAAGEPEAAEDPGPFSSPAEVRVAAPLASENVGRRNRAAR